MRAFRRAALAVRVPPRPDPDPGAVNAPAAPAARVTLPDGPGLVCPHCRGTGRAPSPGAGRHFPPSRVLKMARGGDGLRGAGPKRKARDAAAARLRQIAEDDRRTAAARLERAMLRAAAADLLESDASVDKPVPPEGGP